MYFLGFVSNGRFTQAHYQILNDVEDVIACFFDNFSGLIQYRITRENDIIKIETINNDRYIEETLDVSSDNSSSLDELEEYLDEYKDIIDGLEISDIVVKPMDSFETSYFEMETKRFNEVLESIPIEDEGEAKIFTIDMLREMITDEKAEEIKQKILNDEFVTHDEINKYKTYRDNKYK